MPEIQIDNNPFPVNTIDLRDPTVLIQPHQADNAKGNNVVVGEPRVVTENGKVLRREVVSCKGPDGKETFKITARLGGQASSSQATPKVASPAQEEWTGLIGFGLKDPKFFKPKRPKIGTWKEVGAKH